MTKHLLSLFVFLTCFAMFPKNANAQVAPGDNSPAPVPAPAPTPEATPAPLPTPVVVPTPTPIPPPALPMEEKDWTYLVYINGHNNLDSFGGMNIRGMEEVGSSDKLNVVVQWASLQNPTTERLYIEKSINPEQVTSPVVQSLPTVDMGDYRELVRFVEWGVQNFPAKHYFISVWNHGNGWHLKGTAGRLQAQAMRGGGIKPQDISYDDLSGHHITTEDLAVAMAESAKIIGHKVDIYGSDACLMAMAEVANEMKDSVEYFVGSEEVEPGAGWPYAPILKEWNASSDNPPREVARMVAREYVKAYMGGIYGNSPVTMSALDLSHMDAFNRVVATLADELQKDPKVLEQVRDAAEKTVQFTLGDYKDLYDFVQKLKAIPALNKRVLAQVEAQLANLVIENRDTPEFQGAGGLAIWLPTQDWQYSQYADRYENIKFNQVTGWGKVLKQMIPPPPPAPPTPDPDPVTPAPPVAENPTQPKTF